MPSLYNKKYILNFSVRAYEMSDPRYKLRDPFLALKNSPIWIGLTINPVISFIHLTTYYIFNICNHPIICLILGNPNTKNIPDGKLYQPTLHEVGCDTSFARIVDIIVAI